MSQKETGTFAIMGADGYMVSSEYLGRTKAHIESFANRMVADNTLGKIYKMTLDENLVRTVVSPENMMVNEIVIPNEKEAITSIRFDVGIEYFERATSATIITASDIKVEIDLNWYVALILNPIVLVSQLIKSMYWLTNLIMMAIQPQLQKINII